MVLELYHGGPTQNFEENGDAFAGNALNEALHTRQRCVFQENRLPWLEVADFLCMHSEDVRELGRSAKPHDQLHGQNLYQPTINTS